MDVQNDWYPYGILGQTHHYPHEKGFYEVTIEIRNIVDEPYYYTTCAWWNFTVGAWEFFGRNGVVELPGRIIAWKNVSSPYKPNLAK